MPIRRADDRQYALATSTTTTGAATPIQGGEYLFTVEGTAGGSTLSLQVQTPNGTWVDVTVFTNAPVRTTTLPYSQTGITLPACNVRMAATGGAPTGLFSYLVGLG